MRERTSHGSLARRAVPSVLLTAGLVFCGACNRVAAAPEAPRLVLLYATCTVNASYLSPYDPGVAYTPHLRRFADGARVFRRHQTEAGQSGIAFASIFSGTQAPGHGVYSHPARLSDSVELVSEAFAKDGYEVFSWLNHIMASAELNYAQGVPPAHRHARTLRAFDPAFRAVLDRLEREPSTRAFIATNFTVTHSPYVAPELEQFCERYPGDCAGRSEGGGLEHYRFDRYRALYLRNVLSLTRAHAATLKREGLLPTQVADLSRVIAILYKASVHHLDEMFGEVVRAIEKRGLLDQSLIVFTADHGEAFLRENLLFPWSHGYQQAPEVLTVPLLIHAPGAGVAPGVYDAVTRSIDVFPTMAGLAGLALERREGRGVDLSAALRGREPPFLLAFSHSSVVPRFVSEMKDIDHFRAYFPRTDPELMWASLRVGDRFYKLRRLPDGQLVPAAYDLAMDPHETTDLYDPEDVSQREMITRLERYREALIAGYRAQPTGLDPGVERELLQRLGYIR